LTGRTLDYIIIIVYLISVSLIGIKSGGKNRTVSDYFLGSKNVPWWAVCFSIVAAETSTLTFISIPGLAYLTNLNFLQVTFGYLIGRIIVAKLFLPAYYAGELKTAYTFLNKRFGRRTRTFASVVFLFTRTAADGVRLFATAIPLKLLTGLNYPTAILIIACAALVYTYTGGLKGVIWVDVVQMFIYLGGAVISGIFILHLLPDGITTFLHIGSQADKFTVLNFSFGSFAEFFKQPYTFLGGIIGGAFLSMASHGTDQLIVQRLLSTKNLKDSKKAVIGSGIIIIIQFLIFLLLGVLLFAYYGKLNIRSDEIFPMFIIKVLPPGLSGLIIAGLFAAALSTLAGSITSLSSSTVIDLIIPRMKKNYDEDKQVKISKAVTVLWTILLITSALLFTNSNRAVVEIALSISSFTYGGLLGTFLLGILNKKAGEPEALFAFAMGIAMMILVISLNIVAWTWYTLIGVCITLVSAPIYSILRKLLNLKT
jgi:solute:Na+ symporter, SSS family